MASVLAAQNNPTSMSTTPPPNMIASASDWVPNPEITQQVVTLLHQSTTPNSALHAQLFKELQRLSSAPDFVNYLAYILATRDDQTLNVLLSAKSAATSNLSLDAVRQSAGLVLKSNLPLSFRSLHPTVRQYVATALVHAMSHRSPAIRLVVSSCMSQLAMVSNDLTSCDPLVPALVHTMSPYSTLQGQNPNQLIIHDEDALDASLCVLTRLSEDVPQLLNCHFSSPLNVIVPACINLLGHPQSSNRYAMRATILQILNHLTLSMPSAMHTNLDSYISALLSVSSSINEPQQPQSQQQQQIQHQFQSDLSSAQVRKRLCTAFCIILESAPAALNTHMNHIVEFMMLCTTNSDSLVAREASEFWSLFAHAALMPSMLKPHLPRLIPILVDNMKYTGEEVQNIDALASRENESGGTSKMARGAASISSSISNVTGIVVDRSSGSTPKSLKTDTAGGSMNNSNMMSTGSESNEDDMMSNIVLGVNGRGSEEMRPRFHRPNFKKTSLSMSMATTSNTNPSSNIMTNGLDIDSSQGQHPPHRRKQNPNAMVISNDKLDDIDILETDEPNEPNTLSETTPAINNFTDNNPTSRAAPVQNGFHHHTDEDVVPIEDDSDEDDDDDDDDIDLDDESEWTLRKSCASALDVLSCVLKDEVLEVVLPIVQAKLRDGERWEERECGVLAVGAIAEGCYDGMKRHMRSIFAFLLNCARTDEHVTIRSIACWTLSRYCKWVISERDDVFFEQLLKVLLDGMNDGDKMIQKASCSALAVFEEESGSLLSTYLNPMLVALTTAFERYSSSNLYVVYDVVCTLADAVGSELANSNHVNVLMPLLLSRWNELVDDDPHMLPLVECLSSVVRALGSRCEPYAANLLNRCCTIISAIYMKENAHDTIIQPGNKNQPQQGQRKKQEIVRDYNHVDFITCCLDLCCAITEALGRSVDQYISNSPSSSSTLPFGSSSTTQVAHVPPSSSSSTCSSSSTTSSASTTPASKLAFTNISSSSTSRAKMMLTLLFVCMKDERQDIRQSAFALLGELARAKLPCMVSKLGEYLKCAVLGLDRRYVSVANNAAWALGEMTIMAGFCIFSQLNAPSSSSPPSSSPPLSSTPTASSQPTSAPISSPNPTAVATPPSFQNCTNAQTQFRQLSAAAKDIEHILLDDSCLNVMIHTVNQNYCAINKSLLENCALTLGRIGAILPAQLSQKLHLFALACFTALRNIRDDVEKEQAFHGFNAMISHNPAAIYPCFSSYVDAVLSWFHCKPGLEIEFACIFNAYKTTLADHWFVLFNSLPLTSQNLLKERFAV